MAGAFDDLVPKQPTNGGGRFDDLIPPAEKDWGPLGLGDNFARAGQTLDDSMRLLVDTGSRGLVDKWMGPEEQAKTAAARERQGWGGTAVDVGGAVATSPYRVGSALVGAGAGAAEGAVSSYAHSDSWVPDPLQIGKDALIGGATGGFGAKVGEWAGGNKAVRDAKADQPYPTDDALRNAADDANFLAPGGPRATDLDDRVAQLEELRGAQSKGRDAFANLRAGNDAEAEMIDKITGRKTLRSGVANQLDRSSLAKGNPDLSRLALDVFAGTGGSATIGATAADLLGMSAKLRSVPGKEVEPLAALYRDPRGLGLQPDPATIAKWRDVASKAFSGYGRAP